MAKLTLLGRLFVGIGFTVFGLQQAIHRAFITRLIPKLPDWVPWIPPLAFVTGVAILAAGIAIVLNKHARTAALLLVPVCVFSAVVLDLPRLVAEPRNGMYWTFLGKAVALAGSLLLVAAVSPKQIAVGRYLLGSFLVLASIQHPMYVPFVKTLVPDWMPGGGVFWTYASAVLLFAGGVGMAVPATARLAALLSGIMILLWVPMVHIPRALAEGNGTNETTAVFEALTLSGAAFLASATAQTKDQRPRARAAGIHS